MKRFLSLFIALCSAAAAGAQPAEFFKNIDPYYYLEIYRPYPSEMASNVTPAPKGYEPFYISHLGRHGSRYNILVHQYEKPLEVFGAAHEAGELTETGERFYAEWQKIAAEAKDRYGDLSELGFAEHRGIAHRMYESYPEVFSTKGGRRCYVNCKSTVVPRCILSMSAFTQELVRQSPGIEVSMEASAANAKFLAAYAGLNMVNDKAKPLSDSIRRANMPDPARFLDNLFRKGSRVREEMIGDAGDFMYDMYLGNAILGKEGKTLDYLFTEDELCELWKASNLRRYILTGPSKIFLDAILVGAKEMVRNVIAHADKAIATGDEQATLRFAHDVTMIPFVTMMGIPCGSLITDDYSTVCANWQCSVVTPMASNVQLIFFRNKAGDILVKVLFCEREQRLVEAVGEPVNGCYYRWADLRKFLESQL